MLSESAESELSADESDMDESSREDGASCWNPRALKVLARSMGCAQGEIRGSSQGDTRPFPRWPTEQYAHRVQALTRDHMSMLTSMITGPPLPAAPPPAADKEAELVRLQAELTARRDAIKGEIAAVRVSSDPGGSTESPALAAADKASAGLERSASGQTEMGSPDHLCTSEPYEYLSGKRGLSDDNTQKLWQVGVLVAYLHSTRRVRAGSPLDQETLAITEDGNYHLAGKMLDRATLDRLMITSAVGPEADSAVVDRHRKRCPVTVHDWRQSALLKMLLCADWHQLDEWRKIAERDPHGATLVDLVQLRGDPAKQAIDTVRRACGGMTNLHVMLSIIAFMRIAYDRSATAPHRQRWITSAAGRRRFARFTRRLKWPWNTSESCTVASCTS